MQVPLLLRGRAGLRYVTVRWLVIISWASSSAAYADARRGTAVIQHSSL